MAILVAGSTGRIGSQVLQSLAGSGVEVRALTRSPEKAKLPPEVRPVRGDLADPDSVHKAFEGVSTLFLLAANVPDELTQAMQALVMAKETGIKGAVYLSVLKAAEFTEVPHFASKRAVELMIEDFDLPVTILRPAYFIQNDMGQREPLMKWGTYGMPVGSAGVSMVDTRDIGKAAAIELARREKADSPLPREVYTLAGPDRLTGASIAEIWSEVLGREIKYGGDDVTTLEQRLKSAGSAWHALDMRLMIERYQRDGAHATPEDLARLTKLLGHAPRSYRGFARAMAQQWASDGGA